MMTYPPPSGLGYILCLGRYLKNSVQVVEEIAECRNKKTSICGSVKSIQVIARHYLKPLSNVKQAIVVVAVVVVAKS